MLRVLFVCTGNTCRSPMAEALLRSKAAAAKAEILVLSAGVSALEGASASDGAAAAMRARNIDLSSHRSRQLVAEYVAAADLILTMTEQHRRYVLALFPAAADKTITLAAFAGQSHDVQDPFGGDNLKYQACAAELANLIDLAWEKLVDLAGKKALVEKET